MHEIMWDCTYHGLTYSFHCCVSLQKIIFSGLHCIYLAREGLYKKPLLQKQKTYLSLDDLNFALEILQFSVYWDHCLVSASFISSSTCPFLCHPRTITWLMNKDQRDIWESQLEHHNQLWQFTSVVDLRVATTPSKELEII
jgi:hypothetical protein